LHPELGAFLERRRQDFIAVHGREPEPNAPLFPSLAGRCAGELTAQMAVVMEQPGFDAAFIYAFRKTGLIVTEMSEALLPDRDLHECSNAVREYRREHAKAPECCI
jgi:hypothetical protein